MGAQAGALRGRGVVRGARPDRGRPRLNSWLEQIRTDGIVDPSVIYGYFPVWSEGTTWSSRTTRARRRLGRPRGHRAVALHVPRQRRDRHLCLADFVKPREWVEENGRFDVLPVQLATMGDTVDVHTANLFAANKYREYMELHGLSVQLTEALAEMWHTRVRSELGFADEDPADVQGMFDLDYRGPGSRWDTRRAPRWRTGGRSWSCCGPSGWAWCCLMSCSCTGAVDGRIRVPPPGGQVLQRVRLRCLARQVLALRSSTAAWFTGFGRGVAPCSARWVRVDGRARPEPVRIGVRRLRPRDAREGMLNADETSGSR
ncbi:vitamin B12 dependent-methionine synthase activation domain-containing protein [Oerskovia sp. M15]